jgi:hypothetical protein
VGAKIEIVEEIVLEPVANEVELQVLLRVAAAGRAVDVERGLAIVQVLLAVRRELQNRRKSIK